MFKNLTLVSPSASAPAGSSHQESVFRQLLNQCEQSEDCYVLDEYLVLVPKDELAEEFLSLLEGMGFIPKTVTWWAPDGRKYRIFLNRPGFTPFDIAAGVVSASLYPLNNWIENECQDCWYLEWLPRCSPEDLEPAALPEVFLCLKALSYLAERPSKAISL
jgi:hypothetical protein